MTDRVFWYKYSSLIYKKICLPNRLWYKTCLPSKTNSQICCLTSKSHEKMCLPSSIFVKSCLPSTIQWKWHVCQIQWSLYFVCQDNWPSLFVFSHISCLPKSISKSLKYFTESTEDGLLAPNLNYYIAFAFPKFMQELMSRIVVSMC